MQFSEEGQVDAGQTKSSPFARGWRSGGGHTWLREGHEQSLGGLQMHGVVWGQWPGHGV